MVGSLLSEILMKSSVMDWCDHKLLLGFKYIYLYHTTYFQKYALIRMDLNSEFSFVETHALVRLVDNEATAIIPVARISAVTPG